MCNFNILTLQKILITRALTRCITKQFGNYEWLQQFGHIATDYLQPGLSDHSPALVQCTQRISLKPKPFRLYVTVLEHLIFKGLVQRVWQRPIGDDAMQVLWNKLKQLKVEWKELNTYIALYAQKLNQARKQLKIVQAQIATSLFEPTLYEQEKILLIDIQK